jgi:tetratricopeptide (TPR) repeat protein
MMYKNKKHLTDYGVARYVEGLLLPERFGNIPGEILDHVMGCEECRKRVFVQYDIDRQDPEYINVLKTLDRDDQQANEKANVVLLTPEKISRFRPVIFMMAATVLVLLAGTFLLLDRKGMDSEEMFNQYFSVYPDILTTKSGASNDEMLQTALYYYNNEQFEVAKTAFNNYLINNQEDSLAQLYHAICHLVLNEEMKAIPILHTLSVNMKDSDDRVRVNWYLGLAYLKAGQIKDARLVFESLSSKSNTYSAKSKDILSKLKK